MNSWRAIDWPNLFKRSISSESKRETIFRTIGKSILIRQEKDNTMIVTVSSSKLPLPGNYHLLASFKPAIKQICKLRARWPQPVPVESLNRIGALISWLFATKHGMVRLHQVNLWGYRRLRWERRPFVSHPTGTAQTSSFTERVKDSSSSSSSSSSADEQIGDT